MKPTDPIFLVAPREMTEVRFKQIIKHYLPKAPLVIGISEEPYVVGFEDQPQFKMLERAAIQPIIDQINARSSVPLVQILEYRQSDLVAILSSCTFSRVLLVNGSWQFTFQNHPAYAVLKNRAIPFKYISPFVDEAEAKAYEVSHTSKLKFPTVGTLQTEAQMLQVAADSAKQSYDYSFQTGVTLGKKVKSKYEYLAEAFNKVVPYQTFALHNGNAREKYLSAVHDITHYDTIHAEMYLLVRALQQKIDTTGTTLFINLLPCSSCARTLSQTDIAEVVYVNDHSDGYAVSLLEAAGMRVRRVKPLPDTI